MRGQLEICVETIADVRAALAGGADRIELCGALALGGLTPSAGLVALTLAEAGPAGVAVRAMVRPRDGDFAYDSADLAAARAEGLALIAQGVDGVVFGAARDGRLDHAALRDWTGAMRAARPDIGLTLHRAVDLLPDPVAAVAPAIELGFDHVLTSGGARRASDALDTLAAMQSAAAGRITIMAGAGVRAANARMILDRTGVGALHASASIDATPADPAALALGFAIGGRRRTDEAEVVALCRAMAG